MKIKNILKINAYDLIGKFLFLPLLWPFTKIKKINDDIKPLFKLIHKLFTKSHVSTFLSFFYPMIFIGILSNVASPNYMIMGIGSLIPIIIGVQVLPTIVLNLKRSSILKRIGATNTKSSDITFTIIMYFVLVSIISIIFNVGVGIAMYSSKMNFEFMNWGEFCLSMFMGILIGISMGMVVSSVVKKAEVALLVGLILTLPGAFLSSEFLPPSMINSWGPVRYISFIFPQKIATTFAHVSANTSSIFDSNISVSPDYAGISNINGLIDSNAITQIQGSAILNNLKGIEVVDNIEKIMSWVLFPLYLTLFTIISIKYFKWGVRW